MGLKRMREEVQGPDVDNANVAPPPDDK